MKNTFFILSLVLVMITNQYTFNQNRVFDEIYKKYADKEGFVTLDISGDLFKLLHCDGEGLEGIKINTVKIISSDKEKTNGINFYQEMIPKLNEFKHLIDIKNGHEQVSILQKNKKSDLQEYIIIGGGSDNFILYIEGNINFNEAKKLSESLDI